MRFSLNVTRVLAILALICSVGCSSKPVPQIESEGRGEVVGGYVVQPDSSYEGQVAQQRAIARKQEEDLKRQKRERDDLERQRYYDKRERRYLDRVQPELPEPEFIPDPSPEMPPQPMQPPVRERY
jgi:hypothetical protein